jgi:hypothetical protein
MRLLDRTTATVESPFTRVSCPLPAEDATDLIEAVQK